MAEAPPPPPLPLPLRGPCIKKFSFLVKVKRVKTKILNYDRLQFKHTIGVYTSKRGTNQLSRIIKQLENVIVIFPFFTDDKPTETTRLPVFNNWSKNCFLENSLISLI